MTQEEEMNANPKALPKIDLSNVGNMDMLGAEAAANVKKNIGTRARQAAKRKFNFNEPEVLPLPSHGKFYQDSDDENLRKGFVALTPMSLADEEILTNKAYLKNGSTFRVLYDTCMASNYPAQKLLSFDATYMMYALRNITYGDDYKFKVTCADCEKEFEHTMNLSDIVWKEFDESTEDVRVINLPKSKFTVTMPLSRLGDEERLEFLKKQNANNPFATETVLTFVNKTQSIKDPNGNEINPADWIEFYHELPGMDKSTINKAFEDAVNQPEVMCTCPHCGNAIKMDVPITADFFRLG